MAPGRASRLGSRLRSLLLLAVWLTALAQSQAPEVIRVALVIGNAAYADAPLANPVNDAKAMSTMLRGLGFQVLELRNATKAQMESAIAQARDTLKGRNGIGLLYYAGHGMQMDWRNYLLPVDARVDSAADVRDLTVDLQTVVEAFAQAGNRVNILVLDACRDNPFPGVTGAKGLAPMDAPPGTLLAYATAPGNVAYDGDARSGNGLYTQFLLREMSTPRARIEDVFKRVRLQVRKQSKGRQVPWESTSLEEDFFFDSGKAAPAPERTDLEKAFSTEKADWDRIKGSTQVDDFYAFLQAHPTGLISEQAQFRLDQLQKAQVQPQAGASGVKALGSGQRRYEAGDEFEIDSIDGFSRVATRRTVKVTFADDQRVEFNGGRDVWNQMGGVLRDPGGAKDPAIVMQPADIALGKRWRSAYTNTTSDGTVTTNFYDFHVVALEDLATPMGTIKAYRVERTGTATGAGFFQIRTGTVWIDPTTMTPLRNDFMARENGKISVYFSIQVVKYRRAARP